MDSALDRVAEMFVFVGITMYFAGRPLAAGAAALALGGSLLVSYVRARGEALGVFFDGGIMQRAERLVVVVLAALLDAPLSVWLGWAPGTVLAVFVAGIAIGSLATAAYRTYKISEALRLKESK